MPGVVHIACVVSCFLLQGSPVLTWTGIDAVAPSDAKRTLVRDLEAMMASLYRARTLALYAKVLAI